MNLIPISSVPRVYIIFIFKLINDLKAATTTRVGLSSLTQSTLQKDKVLDKLRAKLAMKLAERITCLGYGNILGALKDAEVDECVRGMLAQEKLQVVDMSNTVVFEREIRDELGIGAGAQTVVVGASKYRMVEIKF